MAKRVKRGDFFENPGARPSAARIFSTKMLLGDRTNGTKGKKGEFGKTDDGDGFIRSKETGVSLDFLGLQMEFVFTLKGPIYLETGIKKLCSALQVRLGGNEITRTHMIRFLGGITGVYGGS